MKNVMSMVLGRFRRNFRDQEWVRVPVVSWQHTSPSVITLEYLPGMKISDVVSLKQSGKHETCSTLPTTCTLSQDPA